MNSPRTSLADLDRARRALKAHALECFRVRHIKKHGNAIACAALAAAKSARLAYDAAEWAQREADRERGSVPAWFASEYP